MAHADWNTEIASDTNPASNTVPITRKRRSVSKIVASMRYCDPWEAGLSITFTDGTVLHGYETSQTGAIAVEVNDERII
jgi:hypothetical protein